MFQTSKPFNLVFHFQQQPKKKIVPVFFLMSIKWLVHDPEKFPWRLQAAFILDEPAHKGQGKRELHTGKQK